MKHLGDKTYTDVECPPVPKPAKDCPDTPQDTSPEALGFKPFQPMVRWFTPSELVRAGVKSVLSSLFGSYADKRELQAVQAEQKVFDYSQDQELWLDYVADLGDGWDATYTIARLLAEQRLALAEDEEEAPAFETHRGRVLVMGGDQVYPTATREEYRNRLTGPYRAALPCVPNEAAAPHLYAIPGNHDWYDGLTSFIRLFCQDRWIGGWKTQQKRGYFALKLPHDWWLWGIDVQLGSDVDLPQFRFFEKLARDEMPQGSKVILCTPEPSWVFCGQQGPAAYSNLAHFEHHIIHRYGHEHVVGLAGDLHTYARYQQEDGLKQRFIAGGGGAYLYPTHDLPKNLSLPRHDAAETYTLEDPEDGSARVFPDVNTSRRLSLSSLLLPVKNWKFALFLGSYYLFLVWMLQSASKLAVQLEDQHLSLMQFMYSGDGSFGGAFTQFWNILTYSPQSLLIVLLLLGGLIGFADSGRGTGVKVALGVVHTLLHIVVMLTLMWLFTVINLTLLGAGGVDTVWQVLLFIAEMLLVGSAVSGMVVGVYLLVSNLLLGVHSNEVLLGQSIADYKNFIRLHVQADGSLTLYPVGVKKVCKHWHLHKEAGLGEPWFEPDEGTIPERAHLIEAPIHIPATAFGRAPAAPPVAREAEKV